MIIRLSASFQRHHGCIPAKRDSPVQPFPQTWNIDLLSHGRSQLLILASEEYSLFSLLIPTNRSRQLESFLNLFRQRLLKLFENIRLWDHPDVSRFTISGRIDRRIIGSQNDILFRTRHFLDRSGESGSPPMLERIEEQLNSTPMSYLDMDSPILAFGQQRRRLSERSN